MTGGGAGPAPDDLPPEGPLRTLAVALLAEGVRQVEHDRHRQGMIHPGESQERGAVLTPYIGSVNHRQPAHGQPLAGNEPEQFKSIGGGALVRLVITDQRSAGIRGNHLRGREVSTGEVRLPRPGGADQDNEAEVGQG